MRRGLLLPGLILLAGVAAAQTFPPHPRSGTVFDGANLLAPQEEEAISRLSEDFRHDTGGPIAVATLESLDRYEAKSMGIKDYATALFNEWRVGTRSPNVGILLVVAKADHKVWVALGQDWRHDYDAASTAIVQNTISPEFKRGEYGAGIVQGCQALARLADQTQASGAPPNGEPQNPGFDATQRAPAANDGGFPNLGGLVCFAAPVVVLILVVAAARRRARGTYGPRYGGYGPGQPGPTSYDDPRDDPGAFLTGMMVGEAMSPPTYDPSPAYDPGPSVDSGGFDAGGSDSGSFDSGSSDGGGGGGDW